MILKSLYCVCEIIKIVGADVTADGNKSKRRNCCKDGATPSAVAHFIVPNSYDKKVIFDYILI